MNTTVPDKKFKMLVKESVKEVLEVDGLLKTEVSRVLQDMFFNDPDFGLELREQIKKRLARKSGKTISLDDLRKKI